jgi:hypothetical protein
VFWLKLTQVEGYFAKLAQKSGKDTSLNYHVLGGQHEGRSWIHLRRKIAGLACRDLSQYHVAPSRFLSSCDDASCIGSFSSFYSPWTHHFRRRWFEPLQSAPLLPPTTTITSRMNPMLQACTAAAPCAMVLHLVTLSLLGFLRTLSSSLQGVQSHICGLTCSWILPSNWYVARSLFEAPVS